MKNKNKIKLSFVIGIVSLVITFIVVLANPSGNTSREIRKVENNIEKECQSIGKPNKFTNPETGKEINITYLGLTWDKINEITNSLKYGNKRIAIAKILMYHKESPIPEYSYEKDLWENRYDISKLPWEIESLPMRIIIAIGAGILGFVYAFIIILSILYIVPFIWYYLLKRVKELSLAMQGKDIK